VAATLLASGERAAHALCDRVGGVRWMIAAQPATLVQERTFFNVNTPDALRQAESWLPLHSQDA
jgi:molybdopterin-guanine dinucleotide biosynthesis protein A